MQADAGLAEADLAIGIEGPFDPDLAEHRGGADHLAAGQVLQHQDVGGAGLVRGAVLEAVVRALQPLGQGLAVRRQVGEAAAGLQGQGVEGI